jgi:hypothetical protein
MDRLRKGRSQVLENNHSLVLGWSPQIFTVLNELMIANENQSNARIVVMADKDKVEMEDEIHERVEVRGKTRIICRNGSPIDPKDLEIASPHQAKSIIVLPPENNDPDTDVIKTVLAITNNPNRRAEKYHIVTQIRHAKNLPVLKLVGEHDNVQAILTGDLIARIVAQTSRQSGLSVVYTELMDFGGDEIYFKHEPPSLAKPMATLCWLMKIHLSWVFANQMDASCSTLRWIHSSKPMTRSLPSRRMTTRFVSPAQA